MSKVKAQLDEAACECDEKIFNAFLNTIIRDNEVRYELSEGLLNEAVVSCQSASSGKRIQIMLLHAVVSEAAACCESTYETSIAVQTLINLCEALSNLFVNYHDILDVSWGQFQDTLAEVETEVSMNFSATAISSKLVDSFLTVARRVDNRKKTSLAALIYAHQICLFEPKSNDDPNFQEIITIFSTIFNGEKICPSLLTLSYPLVEIITKVQFETIFVPIFNEILDKLTSETYVLEFVQTCSIFITMLIRCEKKAFLDRCNDEECLIPILVERSMEVIIKMTTEAAVSSVSELLCVVMQACPAKGFAIVSVALLNTLSIDASVFSSMLECREFLQRVNKCLEKVAHLAIDLKGNGGIGNDNDQKWCDLSSQVIQILWVMDNGLTTMTLPAWKRIHEISGGEVNRILPLANSGDKNEYSSHKRSIVLNKDDFINMSTEDSKVKEKMNTNIITMYPTVSEVIRRGSLQRDAVETSEAESDCSSPNNGELSKPIEHPLINRTASRSSLDQKIECVEDSSLDQKIECVEDSSLDQKIECVEDSPLDRKIEVMEDSFLDRRISSKLAPHKGLTPVVERYTDFSSLDEKIASKLGRKSVVNTAAMKVTDGSSRDQKVASTLCDKQLLCPIQPMADKETGIAMDDSSLDQKIASKLATKLNVKALGGDTKGNCSLNQKIAFKVGDKPGGTKVLDEVEDGSSLDRKIASKLGVVNYDSSLDRKIASKLGQKRDEKRADSDNASISSLDQKIISKLTPKIDNPAVKMENLDAHKVSNDESLDQRIASKIKPIDNFSGSNSYPALREESNSIFLNQKIVSKLTPKIVNNPVAKGYPSIDKKVASKLLHESSESPAAENSASSKCLDQKATTRTPHESLKNPRREEVVSSNSHDKRADKRLSCKTFLDVGEAAAHSALDQKISLKLTNEKAFPRLTSNEHPSADLARNNKSLDEKIDYSHAASEESTGANDQVTMTNNTSSAVSSSTLSDLCYSVDKSQSRLSLNSNGSITDTKLVAHSTESTKDGVTQDTRPGSLIGGHYISDSESRGAGASEISVERYDGSSGEHLKVPRLTQAHTNSIQRHHDSDASSNATPLMIDANDSDTTIVRKNCAQVSNISSSEMVGLLTDVRENIQEEEAAIVVDLTENQFNSNTNAHKNVGDGEVVVAMAIEDDDMDEVDEAAHFDPSTRFRLDKKMRWWVFTSFLAAVIVALVLIIFLSRKKLQDLEVDNTTAPSFAPTTEIDQQISLFIRNEFGLDKSYDDEETPYGKVFDWIIRDIFTLDAFESIGISLRQQVPELSMHGIRKRFLCGLLYYEMGGDEWVNCSASLGFRNLTCYNTNRDREVIEGLNWLSPVDVCAWAGIICDENKDIIILDLNHLKLSGTIPPEIGLLDDLLVLSMINNTIKGQIPREIGRTNKILDVDLHLNKLSGEIPIEFYSLTNLLTFNLGYNKLNGIISPLIGNMVDLKSFHVHENSLSGAIPGRIGDLNLDYLTLSSNRFTNLPVEFGFLTNLRTAFLDKNKFNCELHVPVSKDLEELRVNNNQFYGELPENLFKLKNLKYLEANNNRFNGTLSPEIGNLTSLLWLNLRDNDLYGEIPAEIQNIKGLEKLRLNYNYFNGSVPPSICTSLFEQGYLKSFYADCKNDLVRGDKYYGFGKPELECECCTDCCDPGSGSDCERRDPSRLSAFP